MKELDHGLFEGRDWRDPEKYSQEELRRLEDMERCADAELGGTNNWNFVHKREKGQRRKKRTFSGCYIEIDKETGKK